jgi:hypothetical protein
MVRKLVKYDRRMVLSAISGSVLFAGLLFPMGVWAQAPPRRGNILFTQRDEVQAFEFQTGLGYQTGTASGRITGTTFVDFTFTPSGPPTGDLLPFTFHNKVTITDIDGDQISFDNDGTGKFHLGVPGAEFKGSGGPLTGTYVVTGGTGKYASWKVGTKFHYRAIATNPPPNGRLGTVYVEVYGDEN